MIPSPDGGIGRRAGLKHQWGNPCRFDPGSGYREPKGTVPFGPEKKDFQVGGQVFPVVTVQEGLGGGDHAPLFGAADVALRLGHDGRHAALHFHEVELISLEGDDVQFEVSAAPVARQDPMSKAGEVLAGFLFSFAAGRPSARLRR